MHFITGRISFSETHSNYESDPETNRETDHVVEGILSRRENGCTRHKCEVHARIPEVVVDDQVVFPLLSHEFVLCQHYEAD